MGWPTDDITTTYLDSATDDPALARPEILTVANRVKDMIGAIYGGQYGRVDDNNTYAPVFRLPSGWSGQKIDTGIYEVTHNLGITHPNYSCVASPADFYGGYTIQVWPDTNYVKFYTYASDFTAANTAFAFILMVY